MIEVTTFVDLVFKKTYDDAMTRENMMVLFSIWIYGARDAEMFFFNVMSAYWRGDDTCPPHVNHGNYYFYTQEKGSIAFVQHVRIVYGYFPAIVYIVSFYVIEILVFYYVKYYEYFIHIGCIMRIYIHNSNSSTVFTY